jgi:hypothetical protein
MMNNSVFGKTTYKWRFRMNLYLTDGPRQRGEGGIKQSSKHNTHVRGLYMIETHKTKIVYDKPVYVGCAVLDLSNLHMMDFHYKVIQACSGNRDKSTFTATLTASVYG